MEKELKWQALWQSISKTNNLLEWILSISDVTSKSSDEVMQALEISKEQFEAMPGIKESKKLILDLKYIHELCETLRNDIQLYKKNSSEDQMRSREELRRFILEYNQIREYFDCNIAPIEWSGRQFTKIYGILWNIMTIITHSIHFIEPSKIISIMHILWYVWTFEQEYKKFCDDEKFKLLAK